MENHHPHETVDSLGLQQDLQKVLSHPLNRRDALLWGVGGLATLLVGCGSETTGNLTSTSSTSSGSSSSSSGSSSSSSSTSSSSSSSSSSSTTSCSQIPSETEGPYPADGHVSSINALTRSGIVRPDIRSSLFTSTVAEGVPLNLAIKLVNVNDNCNPLANYAMYVWHCDRAGNYSLYATGLTNEDYLRGVQQSSASGMIYFNSIVPGCYSGRWPHIHFEIYPSLSAATSYRNQIKTSQFALPSDMCSSVYSNTTGYTSSQRNLASISLSSDNIFNDGYSTQMMTVTGNVNEGYTATIVVGIAV